MSLHQKPATGGERTPNEAALFKRAGQLQAEALSLPQAAVQSYEAALAVDPTDLDAARAVAELLDDPARRERHARQFEHAVRERVAHEGRVNAAPPLPGPPSPPRTRRKRSCALRRRRAWR